MNQTLKSRRAHSRNSAILLTAAAIVGGLLLPGRASAVTGLAVDVQVLKHQTASASVVSPSFSTAQAGELILAFVATDGPAASGSQQINSVSGGGLTWQLRVRTNTRAGTSEIWQARADARLTNAAVTATLKASASSLLVVTSLTGADLATGGATASANAASGAPSVSLTTTRAGSWVWGVGNDWDGAIARTVGPNQTKVDEYLPSVGDSYWVQRQTNVTPSTGTLVTINDTVPTTDRWNLAAIEIRPALVDTTAPTVPTGLSANATGPNRVDLAWAPSTDDVSVTGYQVWRNGTQIATTSTNAFSDVNAQPSTSYSYTVRAFDAAGNTSADSVPASVVTPAPDTTAPVISNVDVSAISQTGATVTWSTDEVSDSQVQYGLAAAYGSSTPVNGALVASHSLALTGLTAGTTYHFAVSSKDAAGNLGTSPDATFQTTPPASDTTPPTVALTSPVDGATVSGTSVALAATAGDNVGVVGVQFRLDSGNLGSEDTAAPYGLTWDTTLAANGTHTLTAVARDAAGNLTTSATVTVTVSNGGGAAQTGQWSAPLAFPAVAIHSALTKTGKIVFWQGDFSQGGQQYLYDPTTSAITQIPNAQADLFCAGQSMLPDGRIVVIGGTSTSGGYGVRNITVFNDDTTSWSEVAPMTQPRWYATGTALADGRMLVTSGSNKSLNDVVGVSEVYSPNTNTWTSLNDASHVMPIYPFIYQLTDGRIAHLGGSEVATPSEIMDLNTSQWTTFDARTIDGSSIVNYAPNKFMKAGSAADDGNSGNSVNTAFTLDMNQPNPTWQPTASMQYPRSFMNLTNLPDGTVLATGGSTDRTGFDDSHGVLPAEVWNPATGQWTTLASMTTPRLYHSVAMLLPDGRVYVAGGGGDPGVPDHRDSQIFSPPYLFKGARPTITNAPGTVQYGASTFVGTPDAANITRVSLIRTGSVTHSFDENARAIPLNFSVTGGGLNVQMPANGNFAPPGYYMLFIVNGNGVPSIGSFVRFPAPYEDAVAPSAPTNLTASGSIGTASLNWTASTDNLAVTGYDIYRSTTPGFTPSAANRVGQTTTTAFNETRPAGTWYYRVTASDGAGNVSAASNEASAVVTADTDPPTPPTNLTASAQAPGVVNLGWSAAADNVGVAGYQVWRDGVQIATTAALSYADTSVTGSTSYSYRVRAVDGAGNVSADSNAVSVTTAAGVALSVDKVVSTHQTTNATTLSATGVTTTQPSQLLVAFLSSDGPVGQSFSSVTGGGLTWSLRARSNTQAGTAEIWQAVAPAAGTDVSLTATRSSGSYQGSATIVSFLGASTTRVGATGVASAATGAPTLNLTTTSSGGWVWGVGDDWDKAIARIVPAGQTKVDEFLANSGDTFWVQRATSAASASGTTVTLNDTSPTTDRWNLAGIEVIPAP